MGLSGLSGLSGLVFNLVSGIITRLGSISANAVIKVYIHKDSFNDTPLTELQDHTPDIGNSYTATLGKWDIEADNVASVKTLSPSWAIFDTDPGSSAVRIKVKWRFTSNDLGHIRILFRFNNIDNYFFVETSSWDSTYDLFKRISASNTPLDTASPTLLTETWYWMWIDIDGNDISVYHANSDSKPGSPLLEATDSALSSYTAIGAAADVVDYRIDELEVE